VVHEFTSWYHQKGTLKKPTIALMQEPDSDTYVSNSGNVWRLVPRPHMRTHENPNEQGADETSAHKYARKARANTTVSLFTTQTPVG
jgi:hypothetical protein